MAAPSAGSARAHEVEQAAVTDGSAVGGGLPGRRATVFSVTTSPASRNSAVTRDDPKVPSAEKRESLHGGSGLGADHVVAAVGDHVAAGDVARRRRWRGTARCRRARPGRGCGPSASATRSWSPRPDCQSLRPSVASVSMKPGAKTLTRTVGRERVGVGLGDAEQAVLRGGVLRRPGAAAHDHGRADVDDAAVALVEHPRAELVDAEPSCP